MEKGSDSKVVLQGGDNIKAVFAVLEAYKQQFMPPSLKPSEVAAGHIVRSWEPHDTADGSSAWIEIGRVQQIISWLDEVAFTSYQIRDDRLVKDMIDTPIDFLAEEYRQGGRLLLKASQDSPLKDEVQKQIDGLD